MSATSKDHDGAVRPLAVVTGATAGIGRELARVFARNGFDIVVAEEDDRVAEVVAEKAGALLPDSLSARLTGTQTAPGSAKRDG